MGQATPLRLGHSLRWKAPDPTRRLGLPPHTTPHHPNWSQATSVNSTSSSELWLPTRCCPSPKVSVKTSWLIYVEIFCHPKEESASYWLLFNGSARGLKLKCPQGQTGNTSNRSQLVGNGTNRGPRLKRKGQPPSAPASCRCGNLGGNFYVKPPNSQMLTASAGFKIYCECHFA